MNTMPTFQRPWFRMLPDANEKIPDADDFGLDHAIRRERIRLQERDKKRRQRAREASRKTLAIAPVEAIETFTTSSGIRAYRQWVPNRTHIGAPAMTAKGEGGYVSLPLVSIQQSGN